MIQELAVRTDRFPQLLTKITQLQVQVGTANLGNLDFVREVNSLMDSVISLEEISPTVMAIYAFTDQCANTCDMETIMEMMEKIQKEAVKVRLLLRQAALQVVVNPAKITEYQSRLRILLENLYLSLASLYKVSGDWVELPLFSLLKSLSQNNDSDR